MAVTATPPSDALWRPTTDRALGTNIARFARHARFDPFDYAALHRWSIVEPSEFWTAIWEQCDIVGTRGDTVLQRDADLAACRFFPQARLNVAENLMARLPSMQPAVVAYTEEGRHRSLSSDELRSDVAAFSQALRQSGVGVGDRVVVLLPNGPEAIVAMLAAASIGASFASASPDFGVTAVLDRFGQIEPVVFIGCDEYVYAGKQIDCRAKLAEIVGGLPSVRLRVCVTRAPQMPVPSGFLSWTDALLHNQAAVLIFEQLPFDHPWYVLFSSGTTGKPKCIVHRAGGVLLTHAKEHRLHCDIRAGDVVTYYTTTGWMMWNWLVSVLATGATVVTYDGSPTYPTRDRLFDMAEAEKVTLLGVSAKFIDGLAGNDEPVATHHDLTALRTICSTGSPLSSHGFEYVYRSVKPDVHLASISGGTDLCGCFVAGVPTLAVRAGEIQAPALAMAVAFVDDDGMPITAANVAGELVCTQPFPSQPLGLWNDEPIGAAGPRYRATYYDRFPGMWAHGDFASWTPSGGVIIHGRSDATLNPAGVRIGTSDIYGVVDAQDGVAESLAFGQHKDGDVRIVLAVKLRPGFELDDTLVTSIRSAIRSRLSPRHVPAIVLAVTDLPRTFSGKLVEMAVADAVNGRAVRNRDSIANPEALDAIAAHPSLRR